LIKLIFLGDLCISSKSQPLLSDSVDSLLDTADFVCVNFEGPIFDSLAKLSPKAGPTISQNDIVLNFIKKCRVTHLNLANNHIMDFGISGLKSTLKKLKTFKVFGAGLSFNEAYKPQIIQYDGKRIVLLAFAEAQFGVIRDSSEKAGFAWVDSPEARRLIQKARDSADWVIVQVHAGLEMVDIPLPEWRERYRELIDLGADLVVGHHPHVLQGSEIYKGRAIYYSLGNFYMDVMLKQDNPGSGGLLEVTLQNDKISSRLVPLNVTQDLVKIDESKEALNSYKELCKKITNERNYLSEIDQVCDTFWLKVYSRYYESALMGVGTDIRFFSFFRFFRMLLSLILRFRRKARANNLLLLHNIRIESHRWVVERALSRRGLK
jgi:poly-gamma-glutamate synthesis protein (capsule biosynthesis protein)